MSDREEVQAHQEALEHLARLAAGAATEWRGVGPDTELPMGFTVSMMKLADGVKEVERRWEAVGAARRLKRAPVPNQLHRSIMMGVCAICSFRAESAEGYDPDFVSNHMLIHFAKEHVGELPMGLVEAIAQHLVAEGKMRR